MTTTETIPPPTCPDIDRVIAVLKHCQSEMCAANLDDTAWHKGGGVDCGDALDIMEDLRTANAQLRHGYDSLSGAQAELETALSEAVQALTVYDDAGRKSIAAHELGRDHSYQHIYRHLCTARDLAAPLIGREQARAAHNSKGDGDAGK